MELFNLANKVVVITGGYGYLGASMVRALINAKAEVVVGGRNRSSFEKTFQKKELGKISFYTIDVTSTSAVKTFIENVEEKFEKIDVWINNAHTVSGQEPLGINDKDWKYSIDGVVGSMYRCIREVSPIMIEQGSGKIINISSMYGLVSPDFTVYEGEGCEDYLNPPHYGVAKAGVNQLTRYFANYLGKDGITVNSIAPGPFPNLKVQNENTEFIERLAKRTSVGRIGKPEDLTGVLLLLASNASSFITGQVFQVDGGWTTK